MMLKFSSWEEITSETSASCACSIEFNFFIVNNIIVLNIARPTQCSDVQKFSFVFELQGLQDCVYPLILTITKEHMYRVSCPMLKQVNPLKPHPHKDFFLEKSDCQQSKGAHQSTKLVNSLCLDMLVLRFSTVRLLVRDCQQLPCFCAVSMSATAGPSTAGPCYLPVPNFTEIREKIITFKFFFVT